MKLSKHMACPIIFLMLVALLFTSLPRATLTSCKYNPTGTSFTSSSNAITTTDVNYIDSVGDLSYYENGEVLVEYLDGSYEVLSYEDEASLSSLLEALSEDETVALFQPNYTYTQTSLSVNDTLLAQQWALYNDGSFQLLEQRNQFPVYDSPFGTPSEPGKWKMPNFFGQPGGRFMGKPYNSLAYKTMASSQQTKAVSGIDINLEDAWKVYQSKRDVVVALIDTGVDYTHEELADRIWVNEDEIAGNGIDDDGNGYIDDVNGWNFYSNNNKIYTGSVDDHGTHGAGTIVAKANNGTGIAGIVQSDNVKLMVIKALGGRDGSGSTASIIKAIKYAEANGASICNLSLGSSVNDTALYKAIANSSMLFVVAAGNDSANTDSSPCYPASYDLDNIISVANLNYNGALHYSSNYGVSSVDLAAPGSYILSTTVNNKYSYMTGSSMAAPMITAAAAMVYTHYDTITLADVKEILLASAKKLDSLHGQVVTGGMLDLGAALSYDVSKLSGATWKVPKAATIPGSAPVITAQLISQRYQQYLLLQIVDEDSDLSVTAYAKGNLSAEYFQDGSVGQTFTVDKNGMAMFAVRTGGTYTFYARDKAGNEVVKVIQLTDRWLW